MHVVGSILVYKVGQPVIIKDHISLTAASPLIGADFVDLTDLYSKKLRELVKAEDPSLEEGVYVHWRGPCLRDTCGNTNDENNGSRPCRHVNLFQRQLQHMH